MGLGDNLMATGMARGAAQRGKKIAFGNGSNILWDQNSAIMFHGNPNIAVPGSEGSKDLEWVNFYKGNRIYNRQDHVKNRWIWNYDFKAIPGEIFFTDQELEFAKNISPGFVLIEPYVPEYKSCAANKTWPLQNYIYMVELLKREGYNVQQFRNGGAPLPGVGTIKAPSFRHALAALSKASLYLGPEGGLHHGAAAVGISAVVIFGGFIPPQVTGYESHSNITGGAQACGSLFNCSHCRDAMAAIKIKHVFSASKELLKLARAS